MKEKIIYYIDVGTMPPGNVAAFLENIKDSLNQKPLNNDLEECFIPIRNGSTRIEVFTENEDEWVQRNPLVLKTMEILEIKRLQHKLKKAQETIERLQRPWWRKLLKK